jgi:FAD binding domain-containing protein
MVAATATLLAAGGAGQVFRETTNPSVATGDGIALSARAGVRLVDLEFVQFHPTVMNVEGAPRFLLSEALRGEGARLVNHSGEPFMACRPAPNARRARPGRRAARALVPCGHRDSPTVRPGAPSHHQHGDRRLAHGTRGAAARREPRGALSHRFPVARRSTLEAAHRRSCRRGVKSPALRTRCSRSATADAVFPGQPSDSPPSVGRPFRGRRNRWHAKRIFQ